MTKPIPPDARSPLGELSAAELAQRTGEKEAFLADLCQRGLFSSSWDRFEVADVERVRLIRSLRRRGIDLDAITASVRDRPDVLDRYVDLMHPTGDFPAMSLEAAARQAGVDLRLAQRFWEEAGLAEPGELLTEADAEALAMVAVAMQAGFPEEAMLQMVRVYADALGRVAETEARLFHFYVHERLRAAGVGGEELAELAGQRLDQMLQLSEPAVLYFHRRGMARAARDDLVLHLAEEAGLLPDADVTGRLMAAVLFVDLSRFTSLTEAMGDATAADVLDRFSQLVRRAVTRGDGRIVKQIGDAFMLVFDEVGAAVSCALEIRASATTEPQFLGTRLGLHWGPVLYREGDYLGATVNLAARIAAEATADQLLVSSEVRHAAAKVAGVAFVPTGSRVVKGIPEPIELYEARATDSDEGPRRVDPVCGMILAPDEAAAELVVGGVEQVFCSADCLQRFVANPDQYP